VGEAALLPPSQPSPAKRGRCSIAGEGHHMNSGQSTMIIWKRTTTVTMHGPNAQEDIADVQIQAPLERLGRVLERLAKGALALTLYGSGSLVVSGILFYFSWKLGLSALLVLTGLLPLGASAYLLWRLLRRGQPPRLWRYKSREAAILRLAQRSRGRLTVAEVAMGTRLTLREAEETLSALVREGYIDVEVSPSGILVYHCMPLSGRGDRDAAEQVLPR
jgi:hypothetical protein